MIAAIHQPNFFPWLGYFDKMARCDVFVILDDVQYPKTGGSWSNRVKLLVSGEPRWITAPLKRPAHGTARIDELAWAGGGWRDKLLRTIVLNYGRHPFFAETMQLIEPLLLHEEENVARYNVHAVSGIAQCLGLQREIVPASRFGVAAQSNERLIELVRRVGCDTYLAGGGADAYQQDALFEASRLAVRYQAFSHPVYPQKGQEGFVAGLSVIDAFMNCGIAATARLVYTV